MEDFQAGTGFCLSARCYFAFCKQLPGFCIFENLVKTTEPLPRKMLLRTGLGETHKWGMLFLGAPVNCLTPSVAPEFPRCLPPCLQKDRRQPGEQSLPEDSKELRRQAPWLQRPARFPLPGDTVTRPQSHSGLVGKALDKKSAFSDSTSVAGADRPSPSSSRCDPTPHLALRESHCILETLRLRLNPVRKDRERRRS